MGSMIGHHATAAHGGPAPADRREDCPLRATLWQGTTEASDIVREVLRGLVRLAGIDFAVVDTQDALLAAAARKRWASGSDLLMMDCFDGQPSDIDRCIAIATQTRLPLYIVHPRVAAVRQVEEVAQRSIGWLPARASVRDLLDLLHALRATANYAAQVQQPVLTEREQEVASLLADGYTNAEIGAQLYISEDTVRKHVQSILHKFGVASRRAFIRMYRWGGRELPLDRAVPERAETMGVPERA